MPPNPPIYALPFKIRFSPPLYSAGTLALPSVNRDEAKVYEMKTTFSVAAAMCILTASAFATTPPGLRPSPNLAKGVEAFPRLEGEGDAIKVINKALSAADATAAKDARSCIKDAHGKAHWERRVDVTSLSPRFVSFVASSDYFCGGAHPDTSNTALVFDLKTGTLADWTQLIPGATKPATDTEAAAAGVELLPTIRSPKLEALFKAAASKVDDCAEVMSQTNGEELLVWPDAKTKGLAVTMPGLPHAVQVCGGPITIPLSDLQALNVDPALLEAIAAQPPAATNHRKL